jgi:hypothetical protein
MVVRLPILCPQNRWQSYNPAPEVSFEFLVFFLANVAHIARGLDMGRSIYAFILLALGAAPAWAQMATASAPLVSSPGDENIARIVGYSFIRDDGMKFLETLSDTIGGRITGSPESRASAELILANLKQAGFGNAHFEEYELSSTWRHGAAAGEVIRPVRRALYIGSYGWVPGTPGAIEVPVVDFGPPGEEHSGAFGRVKGAAVIVDLRSNGSSTAYVGSRAVLAKQLGQAGAAAMFIVSDKPDRMVYTSAFGFYPRGPLPVISIASEDAAFLRRLLAKGPVEVRLDVQNTFGGRGSERNVVADLEGSDPAKWCWCVRTLMPGMRRKEPMTTARGWPLFWKLRAFSSYWESSRSTPFASFSSREKSNSRTAREPTSSVTKRNSTIHEPCSTSTPALIRRWVSRSTAARTTNRNPKYCLSPWRR